MFPHSISDESLIRRICSEIELDIEDVSVVRPKEPFSKPTHLHNVLSDVVYLVATPLRGWEVVVFLDQRPVLQRFKAFRLPGPVVPIKDAIDVFQVNVEVVEVFRLWIKGGRRLQERLFCNHLETLVVRLEEEDVEFNSNRSISASTDSDSDSAHPQEDHGTEEEGLLLSMFFNAKPDFLSGQKLNFQTLAPPSPTFKMTLNPKP